MDRLGPALAFGLLAAVVGLTAWELAVDRSPRSPGPAPASDTGVVRAGAAGSARDTGRRAGPAGAAAAEGGGGRADGSVEAGRAPDRSPASADRDSVASGPSVTTQRRRYAVSGTTARQLRRSLRESGRRIEGQVAFAWTDWSLDVGYRFRRTGDRCRIVRPDVKVRIVVTLPEWRERGDAGSGLEARWRRDLERMEEHEDGHVRRARRAGRRVHAALERLAPAPCALLRDRAEAAADTVLAEERRAQDAYDRRTGHGRRQEAARPSG